MVEFSKLKLYEQCRDLQPSEWELNRAYMTLKVVFAKTGNLAYSYRAAREKIVMLRVERNRQLLAEVENGCQKEELDSGCNQASRSLHGESQKGRNVSPRICQKSS